MSEEQNSESYKRVQDDLRKIKQNLIDLLNVDLSQIHVDMKWSWVPYVQEHLSFLVEQVDGLVENLADSPPPMRDKITDV